MMEPSVVQSNSSYKTVHSSLGYHLSLTPSKKTLSLSPPSISFFQPTQKNSCTFRSSSSPSSSPSFSCDLKIASREKPAVQTIRILRPSRPVDLMVQQNVTSGPVHRARQPAIRKAAFRLRAQANVLGRVGRQIGPVDPEAEQGVGERGWVVDEDLGDVDVAD